jgi:hypothetical protein
MVRAEAPSGACQIRGAVAWGASPLPALGALPLPRHPRWLQAGRDALLGAWCGGWGGVSTTDLVVGVDDRSSDQAANRKDQLGGECG